MMNNKYLKVSLFVNFLYLLIMFFVGFVGIIYGAFTMKESFFIVLPYLWYLILANLVCYSVHKVCQRFSFD